MPANGEAWRIQRLEEACERHEKDIYRGNGKPGLTTRMEKMEEAVGAMKYYFRAIVVMLAGLVIHALWAIVTKH